MKGRPEPKAERDQLQARRGEDSQHLDEWRHLPGPPTMGTLCDVDPALLVTPPPGLEVGYVRLRRSSMGRMGDEHLEPWPPRQLEHDEQLGCCVRSGGGWSLVLPAQFRAGGELHDTNDLSNGLWANGGFAVNQ